MNWSTILTGLSTIGVMATGYLSGRAGASLKEKGITAKDLKDPKVIKDVIPDVAPPIIVGGLTVASIIGIDRINAKKIAVITASGLGTAEAFKLYKDKVLKVVGQEKYEEVKKLVTDDINKHVKTVFQKNPDEKFQAKAADCEEIWIVDGRTKQQVIGTLADLYKNEMEFNRIIQVEDKAAFSDWLDLWGMEVGESDPIIGYDVDYLSEMGVSIWVDFEHHWDMADDGKKRVTVFFSTEPVYSSQLAESYCGE